MACVQACGSAQAYHHKHKASVEQMCHKAHSIVNKHCHEQAAMTGGCIQNNAKGNCITFLTQHDWSGHAKDAYPHSIARCHSGTFSHIANCIGHSDEAAVVYTDGCGSAWLLAWSVKGHQNGCGNPNKVYIESGPVQNYMCINWCSIKAKLDKSCETSYYVDQCNGNEGFAKISGGKKAALVATFQNLYC